MHPVDTLLGEHGARSKVPFDITEAQSGDVQIDISEFQGLEQQQEHNQSLAPSESTRLSPLGPFRREGNDSHAVATCPIALLDDWTVANQSQTQSQVLSSEPSGKGKGYSKNMIKAVAVRI